MGITPCQCEFCCPENPRYEDTFAYRLECLAKSLLRWPLAQRRAFLSEFEKQHGPLVLEQLHAHLQRLWAEKRPQLPIGISS